MALLLVYGKNNTHRDPLKDLECYKRGDIVEVLDDTKHDGDVEKNPIAPPFYLIRVVGVTKAQALKYMAREDSLVSTAVRRRRWQLRVDAADLPARVRNELQQDRYTEVAAAQIRPYLYDKITDTVGG